MERRKFAQDYTPSAKKERKQVLRIRRRMCTSGMNGEASLRRRQCKDMEDLLSIAAVQGP